MRVFGEFQDVRQGDEIDALGVERQFVEAAQQLAGIRMGVARAMGAGAAVQRQCRERHAVLAQGVNGGQAHLHGVIAEDVRHDLVVLARLPFQHVLAGRRGEPFFPIYNRSVGHRSTHVESGVNPRIPGQLYLGDP
ncbi:hypothetical protein D3C72_1618520 [compost metagenome]